MRPPIERAPVDLPPDPAPPAQAQLLPPEPVLEQNDVDEEPAAKRRRITRKPVAWLFVERIRGEEGKAKCRLGCLNLERTDQLTFSVSSTSHVERHLTAKHPSILKKFEDAKNDRYNIETLEREVEAAEARAFEVVSKRKANSDKFFHFVDRGLEHKLQCDLELLLWSITNGVSRSSLNCPILDLFLKHVGAAPAANRHDLSQLYIQQLDLLVKKDIRFTTKNLRSASAFLDGWTDLLRRFFLDLGIAFIDEPEPGVWVVEVIDLDLIPIHGSVTGDVIEVAVRESIEEFLPSDCLIASSTNDGSFARRNRPPPVVAASRLPCSALPPRKNALCHSLLLSGERAFVQFGLIYDGPPSYSDGD